MRIAFITSEYSGLPGSGGVGTYFHQAAKCLSALGHEVEILTSGVEGDLPPLQRVSYIHLGNDHPRLFCHRAALALRERHQHKPFDILEYAELNAEGYLASELVPEIARVVRIHAPSVILNRYLDFPRSKSKLMHDLANNLRSIIGARRCGIPVPPLAFEPVYFPWPSGSDAEERRFGGCHE
jgi:glycosyltransferase involved in cell wall biosynthesis